VDQNQGWLKYNPTVLGGPVTTVTLAGGGTGYPVSSTFSVKIVQAGSDGAATIPLTTDGTGVVTSIGAISVPGHLYTVANGLAISNPIGGVAPATPATVNITVVTAGVGNNITAGAAGWVKALSVTPGSALATLVVADAATVTGTALFHLQGTANGRTAFLNLRGVGVKFNTGLSYTLVGTASFAQIYYVLA